MSGGTGRPLAHSARAEGHQPQYYDEHVLGVVDGARDRATRMVAFHPDPELRRRVVTVVRDASDAHDLGKLDPDIQQGLSTGRRARLKWDHIDAGVAYLSFRGAWTAAWLVRAHHPPGFPAMPEHFATRDSRRLRGRRNDADLRHQEQIDRTNGHLDQLVALHRTVIGPHEPTADKPLHGLTQRLALSALVDADHADSARHDTGRLPPEGAECRWPERLAALDRHVAELRGDGRRDDLRRAFYEACRSADVTNAVVGCEGPVGIGKTTAVTAYLVRRAIATNARRLIIVAPFTAILTQTAKRLRAALVLPGERADTVIAEHHHRADFEDVSSRDLAVLWSTPIVVTTAVQFFETLAANDPARLRKLHQLPGSVVFIDEAHAALPSHLWAQNWRWLRELVRNWSCSFVFASGSLVRFWEVEDVVGDEEETTLPELVPPNLFEVLKREEGRRVRYVTHERKFDGPIDLAAAVLSAPGPRLLIMNTVQSASLMALKIASTGRETLHISTALCPRDRDRVLATIASRLKRGDGDLTVVATSVLEAGVELSFRTSFRERFGTASLIQVGGRTNRHFEQPEGAEVHDFVVSADGGLTPHPAAAIPALVLGELFRSQLFASQPIDPARLVTEAMRLEVRRDRGSRKEEILRAEEERRYPDVASLCRVIDEDTRLVVVDRRLLERLTKREMVRARELLKGSVQLWAKKIETLGLIEIDGRPGVYWWPHEYDPHLIGYMAGALKLAAIADGTAAIIL